ncbi:hypothetical protein GMOD_00006232 [Pyrenophora seminiperda CCB06]|uniref:Uncharacterized protein n=1 Tax=Pyrenophora seminiperda CCB06 TaxID=1302712 RepID=A0A3M7M4M7_9PLEO|nr:hypothetical protein GMOD_00006232 [Pyrenophora seminiperda CCB06]
MDSGGRCAADRVLVLEHAYMGRRGGVLGCERTCASVSRLLGEMKDWRALARVVEGGGKGGVRE